MQFLIHILKLVPFACFSNSHPAEWPSSSVITELCQFLLPFGIQHNCHQHGPPAPAHHHALKDEVIRVMSLSLMCIHTWTPILQETALLYLAGEASSTFRWNIFSGNSMRHRKLKTNSHFSGENLLNNFMTDCTLWRNKTKRHNVTSFLCIEATA